MPNKLCLLWKCVNLPKLNFISSSFCCSMLPISVGHKRDSCVKCEGYKWSSSPFVAHPHCLTCWLTHWYKAVTRSATTPPSPRSIFISSASWTRCTCLALWWRTLGFARHLYHKGQSQKELIQVSVCPPGLQLWLVFPAHSCSPPTLYYLPFPITCPADFKL